jgi:hypothetical protein
MYGPVRMVVWEGWGREAPAYPDGVQALVMHYYSGYWLVVLLSLAVEWRA